jgi:FAD/FMN-containing dehydrogenase
MTNTSSLAPASVDAFRQSLSCPVLVRGDDGIADEVGAFNTLIQHEPDVVVAAATEADVAAAVRFAAEHGLAVHVRATGHGAEAPITSGLMISTQRLDTVELDPGTRTATIGAGARWRAVIDAAAPFGLAPVTGSSVNVGAVGYTLGGGLGPLVRSHGFTSDWARAFRVVTATGEIVTADAHSNPDLFWALRGGKGGLGVVTQLTIELAAIPSLYAGGLFFDGANVETALRAWVDWLPSAPESVSTSVALLRMPDLEFIPAPLRGRNLVNLRFAFAGDAAEGERMLAPLRAAAPVYIDGVGPMALTDVATIHNDPEAGGPSWTQGIGLGSVDQDLITALLELAGPDADSPFVAVELRHLGAAAARDVPEGSSVGGRDAAAMLSLIAAGPGAAAAAAKADAIKQAAAPWLSATTTVNFAGDITRDGSIERSWPADIAARLATIRAQYDPQHLFAFGPGSR